MSNKVYCCFQFFNEIELLKLKIEELYDVVDYFVISESCFTHSGKQKPFNFVSNEHLFKKYKNKIIYQTVFDTPIEYTDLKYSQRDTSYNLVIDKLKAQTHWDKNVLSYGNDSFEKEILIRPLINAGVNDDDIVILGDCDEIPRNEIIGELICSSNTNTVYHLQHDFYWYYLNVLKNERWYGNMLMRFKTFRKNSFCVMRNFKEGEFIQNAGWHFSYMGGYSNVKLKIESWGEQSLNQDWVKDGIKRKIDNCLSVGSDLFGRPSTFTKVPISYETHPKYLVDNQSEFEGMILA